MDVYLDGKIFKNFEKNPKARSEWAESQVRKLIEERMKFNTYRTSELNRNNIELETGIRLLVDEMFKNKDMHSIDLFYLVENESMRNQRKKDEIFVREVIERNKPSDLGEFCRKRHYHFIISYDKSGKRVGVRITPTIFFVEVKSRLKDSKPPIISITEAYKLNYAIKELGLPIVIALVIIDIKDKSAEIGMKLVKEFKGIGDKWIKVIPDKSKGFPKFRVGQLPKNARKPLPLKIHKGEEEVNVQFIEPESEIKINGEVFFSDKVKIVDKK